MMPDTDKIAKAWDRCNKCNMSLNADEEGRKAYLDCEYTVGMYCGKDRLIRETIDTLKEQESLIHFLEHQREKGHWIFGETNGHGWMKCSQCLVSQDRQTLCYLFCPCCGADMSEESVERGGSREDYQST